MKSLATIALMIALAGCKSAENSPTSPTNAATIPESLVGTWSAQSATVNGSLVPLAQIFGWQQGSAVCQFTFGSDGSFSYAEFNAGGSRKTSQSGSVTVGGQNFTIVIKTADGQPLEPRSQMSGTWSVSQNQLVLKLYSGSDIILILFMRSG